MDYGVDGPGVMRNFLLTGIALLVLSRFVPAVTAGGATFIFSPMFRNTGIGCIASGVLDVGTGAGLLLIGAAKKLNTGEATGVDVWSTVNLSGNTSEGTSRNAEIEGVKERWKC